MNQREACGALGRDENGSVITCSRHKGHVEEGDADHFTPPYHMWRTTQDAPQGAMRNTAGVDQPVEGGAVAPVQARDGAAPLAGGKVEEERGPAPLFSRTTVGVVGAASAAQTFAAHKADDVLKKLRGEGPKNDAERIAMLEQRVVFLDDERRRLVRRLERVEVSDADAEAIAREHGRLLVALAIHTLAMMGAGKAVIEPMAALSLGKTVTVRAQYNAESGQVGYEFSYGAGNAERPTAKEVAQFIEDNQKAQKAAEVRASLAGGALAMRHGGRRS